MNENVIIFWCETSLCKYNNGGKKECASLVLILWQRLTIHVQYCTNARILKNSLVLLPAILTLIQNSLKWKNHQWSIGLTLLSFICKLFLNPFHFQRNLLTFSWTSFYHSFQNVGLKSATRIFVGWKIPVYKVGNSTAINHCTISTFKAMQK